MNDLSKKSDRLPQELQASDQDEATNQRGEAYGQLQANLLLLYQSYLNKEAVLEPALKMAVWRMVQFSPDFQEKIKLLQLAILKKCARPIDADWEEAKKVLFPLEEGQIELQAGSKAKTIKTYKTLVFDFLEKET